MNYFRKILLTGISIIIAIPVLFSQTFFFDNYSVKNGLAQSNVYSIIQDKSGYVWMGTASGVSKFDGAEFINITTENGLAENGVRTIFEDSVGNLWFGHTGGKISFYDGKSFKELQLDTLISNADITSIVEDNNGQIWISSRGAGAILLQNPYADSLSEIKYKQFKGQEGLSDRIYKIVRLSNNNICFITDFGIKEFDGKKNTFDNFKLKGLSYFSQITSMYEDRNGNWQSTSIEYLLETNDFAYEDLHRKDRTNRMHFEASGDEVEISHSTDFGVSFSSPRTISIGITFTERHYWLDVVSEHIRYKFEGDTHTSAFVLRWLQSFAVGREKD